MAGSATFLFDVASPNSYLVHRVIPGIEARSHIAFDYRPVLLGGLFKLTGNQAPMIANAAVPAKLAYDRRDMARFIERHGLTSFRFNPHFPVNTLLAMRAIVAGQRLGVGPETIEALLSAMWEHGRNLADEAELATAIRDAGLPAAELLDAVRDETVKATLMQNTQSAADAGAFGVPSFLVAGELYFGKERLHDVEEAAAVI